MTMQAIVTRYIGPTSFRPGRIKAHATAGSVTVEYDHGLDQARNHAAAAEKLANKFGWTGHYVQGGMPDGSGDVFVCTSAGDGFLIA